MMLIFPDTCRAGALSGLLLCGRVVIPALFPFCVCALMLMRSGAADILGAFGSYGGCAAVILLSMLGGYPVGAGLVKEMYESGALDRRSARLLLCCSVNAGPAFLVIAVGAGVFGSRSAGYILLFSHIAASLILSLTVMPFIRPAAAVARKKAESGELFVKAAADSAGSMLSVCAFVIFFSALGAYLSAAAARFRIFEIIAELCEVTSGTARCGNFYVAAFLLGFAGFSVWFQVLAASGEVGLSPLFVPARIAHGGISALLCLLLSEIFGLSLPTLGNGTAFTAAGTVSGTAAAVSLAVMLLLLLLRIYSGKRLSLKDDML